MNNTDRVFVAKGWGHEVWIVNRDYCGKLLYVKKGRRCSWHYHNVKDETFYVDKGVLLVRFLPAYKVVTLEQDGWTKEAMLGVAEEVLLRSGDSFHVSPGTLHQFEGRTNVDLFEFSTTHRDEDSIRIIKGD